MQEVGAEALQDGEVEYGAMTAEEEGIRRVVRKLKLPRTFAGGWGEGGWGGGNGIYLLAYM